MEPGSREELSHLAMEHVADVIWIADLDNRLVYVSPSITRVLGYTVEEAMINTIEDVFTPQSLVSIKKIRAEEYDEKQKRKQTLSNYRVYELEMYHKNGSIIPVEIKASFVFNSNGEPIGFLSVARNITEVKQADKKIKLLYNQEKKVRESLEAEIKKRSELERTLVNELNGPLTSIYASAGILLESNQESPYDRVTKSIQRNSSELNERISKLANFTRAEVVELRIKLKRVNPSIMIRETIKDIKPIISESNLRLVTQIPSVLPQVNADEKYIRQVMQNLVANAIKATAEGGEIVIKVIENGAFLIIQIQDTGRGISPKDQVHIFEPYYRVLGSFEQYEGMGLGLTLSKRIVALHGGRIWVESKVGKGSTFSFSIPFSKS